MPINQMGTDVAGLVTILITMITSIVRAEVLSKTNRQDLKEMKDQMNSQHSDLKGDLGNQMKGLYSRAGSIETSVSALTEKTKAIAHRTDRIEKTVDEIVKKGGPS